MNNFTITQVRDNYFQVMSGKVEDFNIVFEGIDIDECRDYIAKNITETQTVRYWGVEKGIRFATFITAHPEVKIPRQEFSSKDTSINSVKLPAVFGKLERLMAEEGIENIRHIVHDYGCGKYPELAANWCNAHGHGYVGTDPYNQDKDTFEYNSRLAEEYCDIGICSNVLNVIKEDEIVDGILKTLSRYQRAYITVYTGNSSGIGAKSKNDCWQRNEKLPAYKARCERLGINCRVKNNVLILQK